MLCSGSSTVRAGWATDASPRLRFPPIMSRYRDRKLGRTFCFVGGEAYADATTRGQIRNAFEAASGVVSNWDVMEAVLDYTFLKLGVDGADGGVGRPIVMTEPVANLAYSRKSAYCPQDAPAYASTPYASDGPSDDRDHLRVLLGALAGLRHRLALLLPPQRRPHRPRRVVVAHVDPRHPRRRLQGPALAGHAPQLGRLAGRRVPAEAAAAQVPALPRQAQRAAGRGAGARALLRRARLRRRAARLPRLDGARGAQPRDPIPLYRAGRRREERRGARAHRREAARGRPAPAGAGGAHAPGEADQERAGARVLPRPAGQGRHRDEKGVQAAPRVQRL